MVLYKYYRPDINAFKALAHRGFWCHKPSHMNDPFEGLGFKSRVFSDSQLEAFRTIIQNSNKDEEFKNKYIIDDSSLDKKLNELRKGLIDTFTFCSFSEKPDNVLMWSHYCDGHRGFVLKLDIPESPFLHQIVYANELAEEFETQNLAKILTREDHDSNDISFLFKDISIKSTVWQYEDEWRIWKKGTGYYQYQPEQLKAIYLGSAFSNETFVMLKSLTDGIKFNIPIYFPEVDYDSVTINFKLISPNFQ